jgi:hypothetical protein
MMQGSAVRDYVVLHEVFGAGVERLQLGAPVSHRLRLPLSSGHWLINITVTAGVSNVSFSAKLADDHPGVKLLGGSHNGAMSPHFSPATMTAFIDDAVVSTDKPLDLVVTFESVGPNAIAVLGHRSISIMAWKKLEQTVTAKPKAAKAAPPKPAESIAAAQAEPVAIKMAAPKKPIEPPALVSARKEPPAKAKPAPVATPVAAAAPAAKTPTKTSVSAVKPKAASKSAPAKAPEKPAPEKAVAAKPAPAKAASAKRK